MKVDRAVIVAAAVLCFVGLVAAEELSAHHLPRHKLHKSQNKFSFFDSNGDNKISKEELQKGLQQKGYRAENERVEHVFNTLDKNNDGYLSFEEFLKPTLDKHKEEKEIMRSSDQESAFMFFDKDKDGKVDKAEFKDGLERLGVEVTSKEVDLFFEEVADNDFDGKLTYEEVEWLVQEMRGEHNTEGEEDALHHQMPYKDGDAPPVVH